jgi:hypothetical protein
MLAGIREPQNYDYSGRKKGLKLEESIVYMKSAIHVSINTIIKPCGAVPNRKYHCNPYLCGDVIGFRTYWAYYPDAQGQHI